VRSGGPAIGFQTVTSQLYADSSLTMGFVYTDEAIQQSAQFPTVAVENGLNKNPQMIMWDPATYPQVKTIADLGKTSATVKFFSGAAFMSYFTSAGILNKAQTDGSYDGTPVSFVAANGAAAERGFGSAEPYIYQNELKQWGKPVAYDYLNDAGWNSYAQSLAVTADHLSALAPCLKLLVPIIQQASVDFSPTRHRRTISFGISSSGTTTAGSTAQESPRTQRTR